MEEAIRGWFFGGLLVKKMKDGMCASCVRMEVSEGMMGKGSVLMIENSSNSTVMHTTAK